MRHAIETLAREAETLRCNIAVGGQPEQQALRQEILQDIERAMEVLRDEEHANFTALEAAATAEERD